MPKLDHASLLRVKQTFGDKQRVPYAHTEHDVQCPDDGQPNQACVRDASRDAPLC